MKLNLQNRLAEIANSKASAIVIAMLITTVLLVLGLALNRLILKEMSVERGLLNAGKAYYAAEAGLEDALLRMDRHIPGYEAEDRVNADGKVKSVVIPNVGYEYEIATRDNLDDGLSSVPCGFTAKTSDIGVPEGTTERWRILKVQEGLRIPLYRYDSSEANGYRDQREFKVQFYLPENKAMSEQGRTPEQVGDVLRWELIGITNNAEPKTSAMSDYLPIFDTSHNNFTTPSSFGTNGTDALLKQGKYYKDEDTSFQFVGGYAISDFINPSSGLGHILNYLVLTNVTDYEKQLAPYNTSETNILYVRLTSTADELVCETAKIDALGLAGNFRQRLDIEIKLDTFLPVFDFVLYRTVEESGLLPNIDPRRFQVVPQNQL